MTSPSDTALDLEPIKARAAAATPGDWECLPWEQAAGGTDWNVWGPKGSNQVKIDDLHGDFGSESDAQFIAHARTDIPALLAEVERLRADLGNANLRNNSMRSVAQALLLAVPRDSVSGAAPPADSVLVPRDPTAAEIEAVRDALYAKLEPAFRDHNWLAFKKVWIDFDYFRLEDGGRRKIHFRIYVEPLARAACTAMLEAAPPSAPQRVNEELLAAAKKVVALDPGTPAPVSVAPFNDYGRGKDDGFLYCADLLRAVLAAADITRHELLEWLTERIDNCVRLGKEEPDRMRKIGWLEDAEFFAAAVKLIVEQTQISDYSIAERAIEEGKCERR